MKAHYFRECHFEKFLVPEEYIKDFDRLNDKLDLSNQGSDEYFNLTDEFNKKYWEFKCEGELYDTKLFIKD